MRILDVFVACSLACLSAAWGASINDAFEERIHLGQAEQATLKGEFTHGTTQVGEPSARGATLWWEWQAPETGIAKVKARIAQTGDIPSAGIYQGYSLTALTEVPTNRFDDGLPFGVVKGMVYLVRLSSYSGEVRGTLAMEAISPNDAFAHATVLESSDIIALSGDFRGASTEPGEPLVNNSSLWWQWQAPADGAVLLERLSGFSAVWYSGNSLEELVRVPAIGPGGGRLVPVVGGVRYHIRGGSSSSNIDRVNGTLQFLPYPTNDLISNAIPLNLEQDHSSIADLRVARVEDHPADVAELGGSLWWRWESPEQGRLRVEGRSTGTKIYLADMLGDLTPVGVTLHSSNSYEVVAEPGHTYYLRLSHTGNPPSEPFPWKVRFFPQRQGADLPADATDLGENASIQFEADNNHAQREPLGSGYTTWWQWSAAESGAVAIQLESTNALGIRVYEKSSVLVEDAILITSASSRIVVPVIAGKHYLLAISGPRSRFMVEWETVVMPENDAFAEAIDLGSAESFRGEGTFHLASPEPGEPKLHPFSDQVGALWWKWSAPEDGQARLTVRGDTLSGIFEGDSLETLERLTTSSSVDGRAFSFRALEGQTYLVALSTTAFSAFEAFSFDLEFLTEAPANDEVSQAIDLEAVESAVIDVDFEGATVDADDVVLQDDPDDRLLPSLWWTWTSPGELATTLETPSHPVYAERLVFRRVDGEWLPVDQRAELVNSRSRFIAHTGERYLLGILNRGEERSFQWTLSTAPVASNDAFVDRRNLESQTRFDLVSIADVATLEPGEPNHLGRSYGPGSRWWQWTAPGDGVLTLQVAGNRPDLMVIYGGESLAVLESYGRGNFSISQRVSVDEVYQLAVVGTTFRVEAEWHPYAPNDDFANATDLGNGNRLEVAVQDRGLSREEGEPGQDVSLWYRWQAPNADPVQWSTTDRDWSLAFYQGNVVNELEEIASPRLGFEIFTPEAGVTYHVRLSVNDSRWRPVTLQLESQPPAINDDFANRLPLSGGDSVSEAIAFAGATLEDGGPLANLGLYKGSVWYEWRPDVTGRYWFQLAEQSGSHRVIVYQGEALQGLAEVQEAEDELIVDATAGEVYQLAIVDDHRRFLNKSLTVRLLEPPVNDGFMDRIQLDEELPITFQGTTLGATVEANEPQGQRYVIGESTAWWSWTAPFSGYAYLSLAEVLSGDAPVVHIYTGDSVDALTIVRDESRFLSMRDRTSSTFPFLAEAGVHYHICVANRRSNEGQPGAFRMALQLDPPYIENDFFADALDLGAQTNITSSYVIQGATVEAGEPGEVSSADGSVWFRWRAPADGRYEFDNRYTARQHGVYRGQDLSSLELVSHGSPRSAWHANEGEVYHISITGRGLLSQPYYGSSRFFFAPLTLRSLSLDTPIEDPEMQAAGDIESYIEGGETVIWAWQAPSDGLWQVATSDNALTVAVMDGESEIANTKRQLFFEAEQDRQYRWLVQAPESQGRAFTLSWKSLAPALNDNFADRYLLEGEEIAIEVPYQKVTLELGEPRPSDAGDGGSLWWEWIAPRSGGVSISTAGSDFFARSTVFLGETMPSLRALTPTSRSVTFQADAGQRYMIMMAALSEESVGKLSLSLEMTSDGPGNDRFEDRITLPSKTEVSAHGATFRATREFGEPTHDVTGYDLDDGSLWWEWTCPETRVYAWTARETTSSFPAAVYTGDHLDQLESVNYLRLSDDRVLWKAEAGETYQLAVVYFNSLSAQDTIEFTFAPGLPSHHDAFAQRIDLGSASEAALLGSNVGATLEPDEPLHERDGSAGASLWWEWQAPADGVAILNGQTSTATFKVYEGASLELLMPLDRVTSEGKLFETVAQKRYVIVAYGRRDSEGEVEGQLSWTPCPMNHSAAGAVDIGKQAITEFEGMTFTGGESESSTVWWQWQAPESGEYEWRVLVGSDTTERDVWRGDHPSVLSNVPTEIEGDIHRFVATAGERYWFSTSRLYDGELLRYRLHASAQKPVNVTYDTAVEFQDLVAHDLDWGTELWWRWVAPRTGRAILKGASNPLIYEESSSQDTSLLAARRLETSFLASEGVGYRIRVRGSGQAKLFVEQAVAHDRFSERLRLPDETSFQHTIDPGDVALSGEIGEPYHDGTTPRRSLWYEWQSPTSSPVSLSVSPYAVLAVYRGTRLAQLDSIQSGQDRLSFQAQAGETYIIAIDSYPSSHTLPITLALHSGEVVTFEDWVTGLNLAEAGELADPDQDGLSNLLEFALGRQPNLWEPSAAFRMNSKADRISFSYARRRNAALQFAYETSEDLETWESVIVPESIVQQDNDIDRVEISLPAVGAARYWRLVVGGLP